MVSYIHPLMGHTTESMQRAMYIYIAIFTPLATLIYSYKTVFANCREAGWLGRLFNLSILGTRLVS